MAYAIENETRWTARPRVIYPEQEIAARQLKYHKAALAYWETVRRENDYRKACDATGLDPDELNDDDFKHILKKVGP